MLEAGDGDINEMTQHLSPDAVMFCFMQVWCIAAAPTLTLARTDELVSFIFFNA